MRWLLLCAEFLLGCSCLYRGCAIAMFEISRHFLVLQKTACGSVGGTNAQQGEREETGEMRERKKEGRRTTTNKKER